MSVVNFPTPEAAAKATRNDVRLSVRRSQQKLPVLAARDPEAALLIERSIDSWMPHPNGGGVERVDKSAVAAEFPRRRASTWPMRKAATIRGG